MTQSSTLAPGFIVVHSNRLDDLRDLLVGWTQRYPLQPLETEQILVHSNGIGQWLKMALAADSERGGRGIAAALDVQLPAQFLWRAYRAVLGHEAVPALSELDKQPLAWRLMRLLPGLLEQQAFQALQHFLADDDDGRKRYQLAEQLADLWDQYQVYRADWLSDWALGRDGLRRIDATVRPLPPDQLWQAQLWRAILDDVGEDALDRSRTGVHQRFAEVVRSMTQRPTGLPRRIMVFGISSMPAQTLEALAALAKLCQVVLCVHNPCRHYWADIIADKELLRHEYRRQSRKDGLPIDLDEVSLHQHAQPLLAAWGRQGRDYINLLDRHDDPEHYRALFAGGRIDLFDESFSDHLLGQLQNDILELRPLAETRRQWPAVRLPEDRSIRFHIAHSAQREVEILHDQLLARFDADPTLKPRDVIVMVPDINRYAPHIDAVFGQLSRQDPRYIPHALADLGQRGREPLLIALERILCLPDSRFSVSEILDLLDVPALRARFAIAETDLPLLHRWIDGAGIRWGLDAAQRENLGFPAGLEANSWRFGLQRMLMGYAVGDGPPVQDIQPYDEVGGLTAALIGPLDRLLERLDTARDLLTQPTSPRQWLDRLQQLLADFFLIETERDERLIAQLIQLLEGWLEICDQAAFDLDIPITIVREAWLGQIDRGGLNQRFLSGAVSFCTLMPMRAIPFRVVCLLGMNDGDYPRPQTPLDFDLMRDDYRPGDRSRREDDRYLMLEALLSAREQLYVSWIGRHIRDNSERPPSVLISQLREHLASGWRLAGQEHERGQALLQALTQVHPLQPFSHQYFQHANPDGIDGFYSYAQEWLSVHQFDREAEPSESKPLSPIQRQEPLPLALLSQFLRHPADAFFEQRLNVRFQTTVLADPDQEPFELNELQCWQRRNALVQRMKTWVEQSWSLDRLSHRLDAEIQRLRREGVMPWASFGETTAQSVLQPVPELLTRYRQTIEFWPQLDERWHEWCFQGAQGIELIDRQNGFRHDGHGNVALVTLISGKLHEGKTLRWPVLLPHWLRHVFWQCRQPMQSLLVGQTGTVVLPVIDADQAQHWLTDWLDAWCSGMTYPLPVACKTAFLWLHKGAPMDYADAAAVAVQCYEGSSFPGGESGECFTSAVLMQHYPTFERLWREGEFAQWAQRLYRPLLDILRPAEKQS